MSKEVSLLSVLSRVPVVSGVTYRDTVWKDWMHDLRLSGRTVVAMNQTHSDHCRWVDKNHKHEEEISDTDACLTIHKEHLLRVRTADCLPILLYHPSPVIGVIHAGRKSTESEILPKTLREIKKYLGEEIRNIHIWFGPAICVDCYQIDRETDTHYDLIAKNINQLESELPKSSYNLIQSNRCTACENNKFFSYRKEGPKSGRIFSFIGLNS